MLAKVRVCRREKASSCCVQEQQNVAKSRHNKFQEAVQQLIFTRYVHCNRPVNQSYVFENVLNHDKKCPNFNGRIPSLSYMVTITKDTVEFTKNKIVLRAFFFLKSVVVFAGHRLYIGCLENKMLGPNYLFKCVLLKSSFKKHIHYKRILFFFLSSSDSSQQNYLQKVSFFNEQQPIS